MFDSTFFAFAGVAALLVLSPGATWAVVTDGAIDGGTRAGLWTVAGIGTANCLLATASAFGLSALFRRFPVVLHLIAVCGALYMAYLGLRALGRAWRRPFAFGQRRPPRSVKADGGRREAEGGGRKASPIARFGRG
ncbi:MAG: LysE family translocator, partial [Bacteroidales bacterium]